MMARSLSLLLFLLLALVSCQTPYAQTTPPAALHDHDAIPLGSKIEFWVYHDKDGWRKSNIHIDRLPYPMNGARARRWAEGVGQRDGGIRWTHYYVLVTHPGFNAKRYRSAISAAASYEPTARVQSQR